MKTTVENFIKYEFKGNGKYYLNSYGKRTLNKSEFSKFKYHNPELIQSISEIQNDAPRGGKIGDFVTVKFTEDFLLIAALCESKKNLLKEAENSRVKMVEIMASLIDGIEGEDINVTAGRLKIALKGSEVDGKLFWKAVKKIRKCI